MAVFALSDGPEIRQIKLQFNVDVDLKKKNWNDFLLLCLNLEMAGKIKQL
jgi:hypothetical protein